MSCGFLKIVFGVRWHPCLAASRGVQTELKINASGAGAGLKSRATVVFIINEVR